MRLNIWRLTWIMVLALALVAALAACGDDEYDSSNDEATAEPSGPAITVRDAWVRATAPTDESGGEDASGMEGMVTGAFMVIENGSAAADQLVRAEVSPEVAGTVELHETTMVDEVMQMRPVEGIDVPANGSAELKPGSFHVMLLDVKQALNPGDTVTMTLVFKSGTTLQVEADVRPLETMP